MRFKSGASLLTAATTPSARTRGGREELTEIDQGEIADYYVDLHLRGDIGRGRREEITAWSASPWRLQTQELTVVDRDEVLQSSAMFVEEGGTYLEHVRYRLPSQDRNHG